MNLESVREFWKCASGFPVDKEASYFPGHAEAQQFDLNAGKYVIDYGAGGGPDSISYLKRGCRVDYCDVVPLNIKTAGERIKAAGFEAKARGYVLPDSVPLPFSSNTYDVASSHGVIHHAENPEPIVAELFRVLKPGGLFYCMFYGESLFQRASEKYGSDMTPQQFGAFTDGPGCPWAVHYTEETGTALFEAAGFKVLSTYVYNNGDFRTFRCVKP